MSEKLHLERHYWYLGTYRYVFYRYILDQLFLKHDSATVLDAGCGTYGSIVRSVDHLVGVDVNRNCILKIHGRSKRRGFLSILPWQLSREGKQGDFVLASLTHLPFKAVVFDIIVCRDVLEHVEDKNLVFNEILRICKSKGRCIGSTTNQLNPLMKIDSLTALASRMFVKYVGMGYERHGRLSPKSLNCMLKYVGFDVRISFFGLPPFQLDKKPPWFAFLWVLWDKLTGYRTFKLLKEVMVFEAVKQV